MRLKCLKITFLNKEILGNFQTVISFQSEDSIYKKNLLSQNQISLTGCVLAERFSTKYMDPVY